MKLYKIYFSPTGGTKRVTNIIGDVWNCEKEEVDLFYLNTEISKLNFTTEDVCIVAVPSFGGRVPETALKQIEKLKGNGAKAVLVAVYGNRDFDDTLIELKDTLNRVGFYCGAAIATIAEHSIMHQFGAGRPDEKDKKELENFAGQVKERFEAMTQSENQAGKEEVRVPGKYPYKEYHGIPLKPKGDKTCTRCGKCAQECPVSAIPLDNPAEVEKEKCMSCMHCIAVCPKHARHNNKMMLFASEQKLKSSCSGRKENQLFF